MWDIKHVYSEISSVAFIMKCLCILDLGACWHKTRFTFS